MSNPRACELLENARLGLSRQPVRAKRNVPVMVAMRRLAVLDAVVVQRDISNNFYSPCHIETKGK